MPRTTRYRGKRRLTKVLAGIGITVLVVSALLGTAYLFLRNYVSQTEDGILLSLPFWNGGILGQTTPPPVSPTPTQGITVVIENSAAPETPAPSPTPAQVQAPPATPEERLRAVFLPQSSLGSSAKIEEIAALCSSGGIDTVVIEVKSPDGVVAVKQTALKNAIEALSGKAQLVAYLSVLQDNSVTRQKSNFGIKHLTGVNWIDTNKSRWINPYIPEARAWLSQQVAACAALPFDALLFDTMWLPTDGVTTAISWGKYKDESRQEVLKTLMEDFASVTSLPKWAVMQPDVLTGAIPKAEYAAQDLAYLESVCDKLFVHLPAENPSEFYDSITAAGVTGILPIIQLPDAVSASGASFADVARVALGSYSGYLAVSAAADYPSEAFDP